MSVIRLRQLHPRKQIGSDPVEEGQVVRQKLGQIDVDDRSKHQDVLVFIRVSKLQNDEIGMLAT